MNYELKERWGLFSKNWSDYILVNSSYSYDTKDEAITENKKHFNTYEVKPIATLVGSNDPGKVSSEAVEVKVIKYKDIDGKIWDRKEDADKANAVIIINEAAGSKVLNFHQDFNGRWTIGWANKQFIFEITDEKVIDAFGLVFKWEIECEFRQGNLLNTRGGYSPRWDDVEKQINRPKMINKLMNLKKEIKRSGKVKVLCKLKYYKDREDGDTYAERKMLVFIGNEGKAYINNKPDDRSCKTCVYRGTDCGYNVSEGNLKPRCYKHATQEDITKRPDVYADTYTEIDKPMYSEFDKGNFEDNFKFKFDPNEYDDELDEDDE